MILHITLIFNTNPFDIPLIYFVRLYISGHIKTVYLSFKSHKKSNTNSVACVNIQIKTSKFNVVKELCNVYRLICPSTCRNVEVSTQMNVTPGANGFYKHVIFGGKLSGVVFAVSHAAGHDAIW